jgi:4-hydroxy-tetrahydrodipicolinate synthase
MEFNEIKTKMRGVLCVCITPFKENYKVDLDGVKRNAEFLVESGVDVLIPCGSTGEFSSLSFDEYYSVVKATVEAVNGRKPVIAGASHSGTHECIKLAKAAEKAGADAIMTVPPYYLKPTWEGLLKHYKLIAENIDIGITVYNNPGFSKVNIMPQKCLELINNIDKIVGIKETSGDCAQFYETLQLCNDKAPIIMGREVLAFFGLACGSPGYISSMANFAPKLAIDLFRAFEEKDLEKARMVYKKIAPYNSLMAQALQKEGVPKMIPLAKEAMKLLGMPAGPVRPPLTPCTTDEIEKLKSILIEWKLI